MRVITVGGLLLILFVFSGRAYIPPAPLLLSSVDFGRDFDRGSLRIMGPLSAAPRADDCESWASRRSMLLWV